MHFSYFLGFKIRREILIFFKIMILSESVIILLISGAFGALVKDILNDNCLEMPCKVDGKIALGFIGSMITGAFVGYAIDGSPVTAAMAGYTGSSVLANLVPAKPKETIDEVEPLPTPAETMESMIRRIALEYKVDQNLMVRIAKCESGLNPSARHVNVGGSIDRGLFQWNNVYHPEIDDRCAYDPECATKAACKAISENHLEWWNASKKCWNK